MNSTLISDPGGSRPSWLAPRHRLIRRTPRALTPALICSLLLLAAATAPADAHVQVRPTTAAPDDAVLFEVLVPNERSNRTVELELAVPAGVIPFSYEETPGWRRSLTLKRDQSIRSIVWRGRLRSDGFARFGFLASTPPREGQIQWKAIQTYDDGRKVRWIGPPDSEEPAAVTMVSERFPRQDVGGEAAGRAETPSGPAQGADNTEAAQTSDDGSDGTARWLAIAALVAALASLAIALLRGRSSRGARTREPRRTHSMEREL
jgi:uncharacterized protein YcnI